MIFERKHIALFFLLLLSGILLLELHVFEHDDIAHDHEHCELCHLVFEKSADDPFVPIDITDIPEFIKIHIIKTVVDHSQLLNGINLSIRLSNKAPPFYLSFI